MLVSPDATVTLVAEKGFWGVLFPFDHTSMHYVGREQNEEQYLFPLLE